MPRSAIALLALAFASCGGRIDHSDDVLDAGDPLDAGSPPAEIAVGDAGVICTSPSVSMGDAGPDDCTLVMSCTSGTTAFTVDGDCRDGHVAIVGCSVDGNQLNTFTWLGGCDCTSLAWFPPLATPCTP